MKNMGEVGISLPEKPPLEVRRDTAEALALAEAVDRVELELRGCPPDVSSATRASWDSSLAPWAEALDLWPSGLVDEMGEHPRFLLLWGPVGCGKSHGAAWLMRRFASVNADTLTGSDADGNEVWRRTVISAAWIDVPAAMKKVLAGIRSESEVMDPKMDHRFTVLDDIGAAQETDYQDQAMSGWIRERYGCRGYTVGTTNLDPDALRRRFPRAASRLMSGPVLQMRGRDVRRKKWRVK